VFAETGDLRLGTVKTVDDYRGILPLTHKRDVQITTLPFTLYSAIRVFVLARAIRILRGQGKAHCSMMINVSRFNDVQDRVLGLVYEYLQKLRNSIVVNGGLPPERITDPNIDELKDDFEKEYESCGFEFGDVLRVATEAVSTITATTINMKGGSLDYKQNSEAGLHVIAIGGLALSRGLTLEGLVVSYILRNTVASDTLMQMARWFGYRPSYEDLCRVYLPASSLDHYAYIHEAIEELRSEVRRMKLIGLTPEDFGLRVRQSPSAIRITAANKMRTATELTLAQDYSCRHIEGHSLINDNDVNTNNLKSVREFVKQLDAGGGKFDPLPKTEFWTDVDGAKIYALLKTFRFAEAHPDLGRISTDASLMQDYVSDRLNADLAKWDVAIPHPSDGKKNPDVLPGHSFPLRNRKAGEIEKTVYRINGSKNRIADPDDAQLGLSGVQLNAAEKEKKEEDGYKGDRAYCAQRKKPLLIVHLFNNDHQATGLNIKDPIVSLSLCLPETRVVAKARSYQVNRVYQKQMEDLYSEPDDDEGMLEATSDA
jgi:hypothetical protein